MAQLNQLSVPTINILSADAGTLIVKACKEFGFFKVINHEVPMNIVNKLEKEALIFFTLPPQDKEKSASCLGYGNKQIGNKGDEGCVEYLLLKSSSQLFNEASSSVSNNISEPLQHALRDYISQVKSVASNVLKLIAQGLNVQDDSFAYTGICDSVFRVNHYPELKESSEQNVVGFGEHTDPQIISILRSNNVSGLEIRLRDGKTWVSVPSDPNSFFVSVGDCLQVMTNGRLQSVRHRVSANSAGSRLSMIYFVGPPKEEEIKPLPTLVKKGETILYKKFKWAAYMDSARGSRLEDDRLAKFKK